jgi:hypothetical protein
MKSRKYYIKTKLHCNIEYFVLFCYVFYELKIKFIDKTMTCIQSFLRLVKEIYTEKYLHVDTKIL